MVLKKYIYILSFFVFASFSGTDRISLIEFEKGNYATGEELQFRLHYGFITAGRASINIEPRLYDIENKTCYNISVFGKTVGLADVSYKVRDTWRTYIDTSSFLTVKSFRSIEEGKYKLKEEVFYDYNSLTARVLRKHPDRNLEEFEYKVPYNVQDIVSGFYHLRRINYNRLRIGDTITVKAFFDKENFNFRVRYMGKGEVHTEAGKFKAVKLVPVMPKNRLFDGEESIKVWISDDKNKIPLMAQVEMFVGSIKLELTSYKGLKNEVSVTK